MYSSQYNEYFLPFKSSKKGNISFLKFVKYANNFQQIAQKTSIYIIHFQLIINIKNKITK